MTWPIFNLRHIATASYEGDARLVVWTLAWDNHAVLSRLPLFDTNIFYPAATSLVYNEHLFGISVFTLPIYALTRNPVLAYNIVWLLSWVACGLAMHALLRRYVTTELAAFAGSLVFTFSFYKMLQGHGHLQQIWTWPLPLSLLLLERWIDRPSWGRTAAWMVILLLGLLGSWYVAVMVAMANGALLVWRATWSIRTKIAVRVVQLIAVAVVAAAVVWPFAAPYRVLAPSSAREVRSLSADVASYLMPAAQTWPGIAWRRLVGRGPGPMFGERTLSLGWIALALSFTGLVAVAQSSSAANSVLPFGLLAIFGLFLSFGPPADSSKISVYSLAVHVPALGGFRAPARFGLLVLFGVAVFAAVGVEALVLMRPRARVLIAAVVLPLMLSEWFVIGFPGKRPQPFGIPSVYYSPRLASARAIASLPDYRSDPHWFWETDYLLFSTAHWRPIVNGYGRWEPPIQGHDISWLMAFPGPNNAKAMRALGVDFIVLHTGRYPDGAVELLRFAQTSPEYELVEQDGPDYLFRVR
jgi:hypothetical protein